MTVGPSASAGPPDFEDEEFLDVHRDNTEEGIAGPSDDEEEESVDVHGDNTGRN